MGNTTFLFDNIPGFLYHNTMNPKLPSNSAVEVELNTSFPLKDGQTGCFSIAHGIETVAGEIRVPHDEPVCWTYQGNWYRRRDGEPMTGAIGKVITAKEFFKMRWEGKFDY